MRTGSLPIFHLAPSRWLPAGAYVAASVAALVLLALGVGSGASMPADLLWVLPFRWEVITSLA